MTASLYSPVMLPWQVESSHFRGDATDLDWPVAETTEEDGGADPLPESAVEYYADYTDDFTVAEHASGGATITATCIDPSSDATTVSAYAVSGGKLSFLAATSTLKLPNDDIVATDTVVLEVSPTELGTLTTLFTAKGVPAPTSWAFEGLDVDTFKNQLALWATAVPTTETQLLAGAGFGPPSADVDDPTNYYNRVLEGNWQVPVKAGTYLGWIAEDGSGSGTFVLRVRAFDKAGDEIVSVAPVLALLAEVEPALADHPIVTLAAAIGASTEIYLKFQYFKPATSPVASASTVRGTFEPLTGATVEVLDADIAFDDVLATAVTSSTAGEEGTVSFVVPDPGFHGRDFYFRVTPASPIQRQYGRSETWSGRWSTMDFKAVGGEPGSYESFGGSSIGRPSTPLVFNVGVPVFLDVDYHHKGNKYRPVAKGTAVVLQRGITTVEAMALGEGDDPWVDATTFHADEFGEVWGTSFDLIGGLWLDVILPLTIVDPDIALPETSIFYPSAWQSALDKANGFYHAGFSDAKIGDAAIGKLTPIRVDSHTFELKAAALYVLKTIRDVHSWFRTLSGGGWTGVAGLDIALQNATESGSVTPPDIGILYSTDHYWDRGTIAHEYSHAVMWQYIDYSWWGLAWDSLIGDWIYSEWGYITNHQYYLVTNVQTAMMDGFADIFDLAFGGSYTWYTSASTHMAAYGGSGYGNPLVKDSDEAWDFLNAVALQGVKCEGAFANAMWDYLHYELGIDQTPDTDDADITAANPSLTSAAAQTGFQGVIWTPLTTLQDRSLWADEDVLTITDFLGQSAIYMTSCSSKSCVASGGSTSDWDVLESDFLSPWSLI